MDALVNPLHRDFVSAASARDPCALGKHPLVPASATSLLPWYWVPVAAVEQNVVTHLAVVSATFSSTSQSPLIPGVLPNLDTPFMALHVCASSDLISTESIPRFCVTWVNVRLKHV